MRIADTVVDLIGNTPLVKLNSVVKPGSALVAAKVEYLNPGGSSKDRIAVKMIDAAEASGELKPGGTIVEPTSGNTGVGLALVAQQRGYKCVFVCPDKVSEDKRNTLRAYGAEVVVCPTAVPPEHPDSYYTVSDRLARELPGGWKPNQYSNPGGPESHYETTGPEIWRDTEGKVTHFVAGVGTGGTITGTGRYLKEVSGGKVKVIGADPEGSVYSGGTGRPYLVEGVGEDFWPSAYDPSIPDEIIAVSDADSFEMTRRLAREEGLLVGGSCGMAVVAALQVAAGGRVFGDRVDLRRLQLEPPAQAGLRRYRAFVESGRQGGQRQYPGTRGVQRVEHPYAGILAVHGGGGQGHAGLGPGRDRAAVDVDDAVAGLESGGGGHAGAAAEGGRVVLAADHEHRPQQGDAQQQVGGRSGGHDRDALPHALVVEGHGALAGRHFDLALVEHLHVATQGNGGDDEFGAVAVAAAPQRAAEADREAQHLHPAAPGDPVMAEFVEGHQHAEADDHPPHGTEEVSHGRGSVGRRGQAWGRRAMAVEVTWRDRASAASRASSVSAAM